MGSSREFVEAMRRLEAVEVPFVEGDVVDDPSAVLVFSEVSRFPPDRTCLDLATGRAQAFKPEVGRWLQGLQRLWRESGSDPDEFVRSFQFWQNYATARAPATVVLIAACLMLYGLTSQGVGQYELVLVRFGALFPPLVREGEWWRLVGCTFLHFDLTHLLVNMYALWVLGRQVERFFGTPAFLGLYAVSGLAGSLAGLLTSADNALSVGASGAIFGLFGAAGVLSFKRDLPRAVARGMRKAILINVGLNVVVALSVPNLGHAAHLGGLLAGALFAFLVPTVTLRRPAAVTAFLAGLGGLYGLVELLTLYQAFQ